MTAITGRVTGVIEDGPAEVLAQTIWRSLYLKAMPPA
jgi:hypothetical protein